MDHIDAAAKVTTGRHPGPSQLRVGAADVARIVDHCRGGLPNEACGLIAGHGDVADVLYCLGNADASPVSYRIESREQFQAMLDAERRGLEVIGCFHSHTHTEAYPSATDVAQAFYPEWAYMVVSLRDDDPTLRVFRIQESRIDEIPLVVVPE